MIIDLLKPENIKANIHVQTWEEAGRASGQLLVDTDGVEPSYIEAVLESVRKYGPYIVIAPGIALFHARPEDGVKKICMSLITLKNGVSFNAGEKDPVKLVFAFGATDHKSHLKALSELMTILKNKDAIKRIEDSEDELQILDVIKGILN